MTRPVRQSILPGRAAAAGGRPHLLQFPVAILPPRLLQACLLSQAHNTWARECLPTHPYQGRWACHLMVTMATLILSHQHRDRLRRRRLDMSSLASPCHLSTRPSRMCRTTSDTSVLPVTRIADNLSRWREITFGREREQWLSTFIETSSR